MELSRNLQNFRGFISLEEGQLSRQEENGENYHSVDMRLNPFLGFFNILLAPHNLVNYDVG